MDVRRLLLVPCLGAVLFGTTLARAQDAPGISIEQPEQKEAALSYEEYRLRELHYLSGRSRIGVIVGGSVTAVGVALVTPAAVNECVRVVSSSSIDDLRCSTRGKRLLGVGIPLMVSGAATLFVTSIMLGVRRGNIRAIEKEMEYRKRQGVRYDPSRGAFTF